MDVEDKFLDKSMAKSCQNCGETFYRDKRCTYAHWGRVRFCSRRCVGATKTARAEVERGSKAEVFERHIDKTGDCWLWTAARDKDGYGIFSYAGKTARAARVALELDGRPVPNGAFACHHCDNPRCVKPAHLFVGSPADNVVDMIAKGRNYTGSRHHFSKLDETAVRAIRASGASAQEVAAKYGVTPSSVSLIRRGVTWKSVA